MKLLTAISILATAGAAVALSDTDGTHADGNHEGGHASCCSTNTTELRASYLVNANPPAPGAVGGTATGRIVFDGKEMPKPAKLDNMTEKAAEGCVDGGMPSDVDRSLIVSKDGGILNAVVEIEVKDAKLKVPETPVVLDQVQCRYEPHITLLPAGVTVEYLNSDKVSHNVHTFATKNSSFNRTIPAGSKDSQKLEKPEAITVKCDIHPWMEAYMFITDTPFCAVTDANGGFSIPDLPAGEYKVSVWHEKLGKAKGEVVIAEDGSCEAIEIKMSEGKKGGGRRRR